jgi:hypothetical protein
MEEDRRTRQLEEVNRQLLDQNQLLRERAFRIDRMLLNARALIYFMVFAFILLSLYPLTLIYAQKVFNPTAIPRDYQLVNGFLAKKARNDRVVWMPFAGLGFYTTWAPEKKIGPFNVYGSNPSLYNLQDFYNSGSYMYWLQDLFSLAPGFAAPVQIMNKDIMLTRDYAARLMLPFGARYLIQDTSVKGYDFGGFFEKDASLNNAFNTDLLKVYEVSKYSPTVTAASRTIKVDTFFDNLALSQKYPAELLERFTYLRGTRVPGKYGYLDIEKYKEYFDINSSFEVGDPTTGIIPSWVLADQTGRVKMSADKRTHISGKRSLRIENSSGALPGVGWVTGQEIPVQVGSVYSFETSMKYQNANWAAAAVEGYRKETGEWIQMAQCPTIKSGTSGWHKWQCSFLVPAGITRMRPALAAGWVEDPARGKAITWFDNARLARIGTGFFESIESAPEPPRVTFRKVSPEKYEVHVANATAPFVLQLGEAYDPLWVARLKNGKTVAPVQLYSMINGFPIDGKGNFDITLEFRPQKWFNYGLLLSVLVILAMCGYLLYYWLNARGPGAARFERMLTTAKRGMMEAGAGAWREITRRHDY